MNDFITPEQELELNKIEELFQESMETVFQTSINPEIAVRLGEIMSFDREAVDPLFPQGLVLVEIAHKDDKFGIEYLLFAPETVAKISDLMVMGDGTTEFNPDEHLSAIQEIADQVFGAFSNSPADFIQGDRKYALSKAAHGDASLMDMMDDSWGLVLFSLEMSEAHQFLLIMNPLALANYATQETETEKAATNGETEVSAAKPNRAQTEHKPPQFQVFAATPDEDAGETREIEMLMDLSLDIVIELGRTTMFIKDILKLTPGSIIELEKLSGDPVDIYVNDRKFAEGEVVVIDENFGVRITELIRPEDRLKNLR